MTTHDDTATVAGGTPVLADDDLFDVREFARTARGNHRAALDLTAIAAAGLEPEAARLLRVLRDLERSTMQRMRNLLVTATHKDARVTAFLTTWAYEKFWLADALDAVLEATGAELDLPTEDGPLRHDPAERADRRGPIRRAIAANFAGPQIVAAHMTAGLVDEWITTAAYRRLAELAHAVGSVVETALEVKDRHLHFLQEEAARRLGESPRARRLSRREVDRSAWPIGAIDRPAEERGFFERMVFGSPEGHADAARIGELVAALPGFGPSMGQTVRARLVP